VAFPPGWRFIIKVSGVISLDKQRPVDEVADFKLWRIVYIEVRFVKAETFSTFGK
jgi:hypothetical protein